MVLEIFLNTDPDIWSNSGSPLMIAIEKIVFSKRKHHLKVLEGTMSRAHKEK